MEESCRGIESQRWVRTYSGGCRAILIEFILFVLCGFFYLVLFQKSFVLLNVQLAITLPAPARNSQNGYCF